MNSSFVAHIQLLSGTHYSFEILKGCRIFHLRNELADVLSIRDVMRIVLFDNAYEKTEEQDVVVPDTVYYAIIQDPLILHLSYEKERGLVLRWNGEVLDSKGWRHARQEGLSYGGTVFPDAPFTLQVDPSVEEEAYVSIIQQIRREWDTLGEGRISFVSYYLSLGPDALPMMDEEGEEEDQDMEELLKLEPIHHLYAYLCSSLPRDRNLYERMLHPLHIQQCEFL